MNTSIKTAMIGLAILSAGLMKTASAQEVYVGHTDHNWAVEIGDNRLGYTQINPGQTYAAELNLGLNGLTFRTAEGVHFMACPDDDGNGRADVRVSVEENGRYWVQCR